MKCCLLVVFIVAVAVVNGVNVATVSLLLLLLMMFALFQILYAKKQLHNDYCVSLCTGIGIIMYRR